MGFCEVSARAPHKFSEDFPVFQIGRHARPAGGKKQRRKSLGENVQNMELSQSGFILKPADHLPHPCVMRGCVGHIGQQVTIKGPISHTDETEKLRLVTSCDEAFQNGRQIGPAQFGQQSELECITQQEYASAIPM